jgi:hypothetical protein
LEEEVMREARVLRAKDPLIYPGNLRPRHVQARSWTYPAMSGSNSLGSSRKIGNYPKSR